MLGAFAPQEMLPFPSLFSFILAIIPDPYVLHFVVKERPEIESGFDERVQATVEYARTIEDFNELIDPRTFACHCLGPETSLYVLNALDQEEKKHKLPWYPGRFPPQPPSSLFYLFFFF